MHTVIVKLITFLYYLDDIDKHPLLVGALHLAKNSVKESSQKSYQSAWNKWEKFYQNISQTRLIRKIVPKGKN